MYRKCSVKEPSNSLFTEDLDNASNEEEAEGQRDDDNVSSGPTSAKKSMNSPEKMVEALTDMLSNLIAGKSQADFDLDGFTPRVMKKNQYREVHED